MPSLAILLETPEPPHTTMQSRSGTLPLDELNSRFDALFANSRADRQERELARAAILLWHDHFDAAHEIAQEIDNADGSLLHGILHRREPDWMNARYWFRRIPDHRSFNCVVGKLRVMTITSGLDYTPQQITPGDRWHPLAFMDFLEKNRHHTDDAYNHLLRQIQSAEIHCFLQTLPTIQR